MRRMLSILAIVAFLSCSKKDKCFTYDLDSWCEPKRIDVFGCSHTYSNNVKICKDYPEGYVEKTYEDENAVSYRSYHNKR